MEFLSGGFEGIKEGRNKYLRELESAPPSSKNQVIFLWDIENNQFNTNDYHPKKSKHRVSVSDISTVFTGLSRLWSTCDRPLTTAFTAA